MEPFSFVRITVKNLGLKIPVAAKPANSAVHPSSSPCFCVIKLKGFPLQNAVIPNVAPENTQFPDGNPQALAASFHLSKSDMCRLAGKSSLFSSSRKPRISILVYSGSRGSTCGLNSGRLLGKIYVHLDLTVAESRAVVFHNGWISIGKEGKLNKSEFHLNVKAEPEPRFVFEFDGQPECSPQIFQIGGNSRQPVFTCKFSFRSSETNQRSRSPLPCHGGGGRRWLSSFGSERERPGKERKGWSITIHDLSGSPVAVASMVTPFVASPGTDRVSRSNPGCWLILRPGDGTWKPWGRLEAWRERSAADSLGYRFELISDSASAAGVLLAESTLTCSKRGKFVIDLTSSLAGTPAGTPRSAAASPGCSARGSGDFGFGLFPYCMYRGFVMAARIGGKVSLRGKRTPPMAEVSVQQVNCTEDAAVFIALAAAADLSIEACKLFSENLRKDLRPPQDLHSRS